MLVLFLSLTVWFVIKAPSNLEFKRARVGFLACAAVRCLFPAHRMSPKMDDIESTSWWLNHPFDKKYAQVNLIISPGIGVKIKNLWHHDHHLVCHTRPVELQRYHRLQRVPQIYRGIPCLNLTDLAPANMRLENYLFLRKRPIFLGAQHEFF